MNDNPYAAPQVVFEPIVPLWRYARVVWFSLMIFASAGDMYIMPLGSIIWCPLGGMWFVLLWLELRAISSNER